MNFKRFSLRMRETLTYFTPGSVTERLFRYELTPLLPSGFQIFKASRYTESEREFSGVERLPLAPTDNVLTYSDMVITAIEVTTGAKGYSYANSRIIDIDEDKLARMDRFDEGLVVERILVGEPHWMWACRVDIRKFEVQGVTHRTDIKIWQPGLDTLIEEFVKLAKREDELARPHA